MANLGGYEVTTQRLNLVMHYFKKIHTKWMNNLIGVEKINEPITDDSNLLNL